MGVGIAALVLEYLRVLIWPAMVLLGVIMFRRPILAILERMRGATLPGGVSLEFAQGIKDAEALSRQVRATPEPAKAKGVPQIPITQANARMLELHLQPSPSGLDFDYYRDLALTDANLALAGLRMEVEILARNLAKGFHVDVRERDSAGALLRKLRDAGAITEEQFELSKKVIQLCNLAVHGRRVSREEADGVLDVAETLRQQYVAWLSWGFGESE